MSRRRLANLCLLLCCAVLAVARATELPAGAAAPRSVEDLIHSLRPLGIDVIFSSELVRPDMAAPAARAGDTPLQQLRAALATQGLELRALAPGKYVVVRAAAKPPPEPEVEGPMPEISVYASRYSMEGRGLADPRKLTSSDIDSVPGSHDDALRALKALPGLASNASGRPYIRGSLADDVLVRYDGITLLDPFHLKNFQSLISAIDPAGVERIEVFSGGFPVRYGTRSGGVIDITAPSSESGYENRAGASLISAGVSSMGRAQQMPLDWLFAIRRSTIDLLEPVEEEFGEPQFSDTLGRLRYHTEDGAWTLGWLLLDDRIELGNVDFSETANAAYRDEYLWLARDHRFNSGLGTRATIVVTSSDRHRIGMLDEPGVALGSLDATLEFDRVEASNTWSYEPRADLAYSFGAEAAVSSAKYDYERMAQYDPRIAAGFGRPVDNDLLYGVRPEVFTYAVHAAMRKRWSPFEAELGLRFDGQHYNLGGDHTQISPRLNLRYDRNERTSFYASLGRFSQAQHVEEWRVEEAQAEADSAQVSIHGIVGMTWRQSPDTRLGLEAYTKRWTTIAPYFDNRLDPLALSPELGPDRIRLEPARSEASGLEVNLHHTFSEKLSAWGTLSWSRVADDMPGDVLRSWDQPVALTAGAAWQNSRLAVSALASWHSGWPRTPFDLTTPADAPGELLLGRRNSERWADFYTLDLRASYTWSLAHGDFALVLEATNATNRGNPCCARLEASPGRDYFVSDTDHWLPAIVNLGFTYRSRHP